MLLEPRGHIYIGVHDLLGVQDKPEYSYFILCFLVQSRYSTSPAVTTVATQTVRLKKNPKASRRTPPTFVMVNAPQSRGWSENRRVCSSKAVALCVIVEVAKSMGGGAVVEVVVRRMSWSMSSRGGRCRGSHRGAGGARGRRVSMGAVVSK